MENCETRHFRVRVWEVHCLITGITERHEQNIPLFYHYHHQPPRRSRRAPDPAGSVSLLSPAVQRHPHQRSTPSHFKCEHIRAAKGMYPAGHGIAGVLPLRWHRRPSHLRLVINGLDPQSYFEDGGDPNK
ncbi:hypothetical protein B0H10DRAFT_2184397 [Mycena sp. CBHHK59/15]|nr:hypothetical protein B0H10DRAFT_2184397 [Mycena sp. CBHHK59/15]